MMASNISRLAASAQSARLAAAIFCGLAIVLAACGGGSGVDDTEGSRVNASAGSAGDLQSAPAAAAEAGADSLLLASLVMTVHKSPTCGCCAKWVDHIKAAGFTVIAVDHADMQPVKREKGVAAELQSCHTATIGDYVIEGHVPADDVIRLLREKAAVAGLAVPNMPMGSPGMEGPYSEKYDVLSFDKDGKTKVYSRH